MKNDDLLNKHRQEDIGTYLWSILQANWKTNIDELMESEEWTKAIAMAINTEDYKEIETKVNNKVETSNKLTELTEQIGPLFNTLGIGNFDREIQLRRGYSEFDVDEYTQKWADKKLKREAEEIAQKILGIDDENTRLKLMKEELNARLALVKIGTFDDIVDNLLEEIDVEDYRF